jgi:uncharacterized protein (DUF486 family)
VHALLPISLLLVANLFMTYAWYGHLKNLAHAPLWLAVVSSWFIALFEYCFQVPANRMGVAAGLSVAELKAIQEVLSLVVFAAFSVYYLGEKLSWNHSVGFALIALGAFFVFKPF